MGGEVSELQFAKSGPTVILLAGLQGVGKTTVAAKLAYNLKKQVMIFEDFDRIVTLSPITYTLIIIEYFLIGKNLHAYCWRCVQTCCH